MTLVVDASVARRVELLDRVGLEDPVGSRLLQILAIEAAASGAPERLVQDRVVDLLCVQLLRAHSTARQASAPVSRRGLSARQVNIITDY